MFQINSEFEPKGDQPQAILKLANGINHGEKFQTLLGVTGSRKNVYDGECDTESAETDFDFGT